MSQGSTWQGQECYTSAGFDFIVKSGTKLGRKVTMQLRQGKKHPFTYVDLGSFSCQGDAEAYARNLARQWINKGRVSVPRERFAANEEE